jgi:hypothetical protein
MENVYYARTSSTTWDEATLDLCEEAFALWETGTASSFRSDGVQLYEIVATDLTNLFGIRKSYDISPVVVGALANPLPNNVTVALKADIGRRGRGTAGRSFWIGLSEGQTTGPDQLAPIAATNLIATMDALVAAIAGVTPVEGMCIPHFVVDHVRPPSVLADIIVKYTLSDFYLDSQRDRLPGHKKHKRYPIA